MAELSVTALTDTILVTLNRADRAARIRLYRPLSQLRRSLTRAGFSSSSGLSTADDGSAEATVSSAP
jgi:hypothetical protein